MQFCYWQSGASGLFLTGGSDYKNVWKPFRSGTQKVALIKEKKVITTYFLNPVKTPLHQRIGSKEDVF